MLNTRSLKKLAKEFNMTIKQDKGPYWDYTVLVWDYINKDTTDGWVVQRSRDGSIRICTELVVCEKGPFCPIRIKPLNSIEITKNDCNNNYQTIKKILMNLKKDIPIKIKELKVVLVKEKLKTLSENFK